jgi:hypothetical protein
MRTKPLEAAPPLPPKTHDETGPICTAAAMLDRWTSHDWSDGLDMARLDGLAAVEVVTRHSVYCLVPVVGDSKAVLVRGGRHVPEFRRALSVGCSLGGALLKQNAVHVGFRMELAFEDMRLVTSEVCVVRVIEEPQGRQ